MLVCNKHRIVFLAIPKTGTRTIYDVLKTHFDGVLYKEHLSTMPAKYKKYKSFTIVRNPYDRAVSQWWSTCKRGNDKRKFIEAMSKHGWDNTLTNFLRLAKRDSIIRGKRVLTPQYEYLNNRVDHLLRFENLKEDFYNLPSITEDIELPEINTTKHVRDSWQDIVTPEDIKLVNELYPRDFDAAGYDKL